MKKLVSLSVLLLVALLAGAQYYYTPFVNAGRNPGNLNQDLEAAGNAGIDVPWTLLHNGGAATPQWSSIKSIPFPFLFAGQPATLFKVSTSGVLTFEVSTTLPAPPYANTELPSAAIPEKSVCIWGLKGSTSNDRIYTKVFGAAPNRQLWIQFNAYEYEGGAPICNLYWAIVLEETSNRIYIVDQRGSLISTCKAGVTAGVQIDTASSIQVAGSPSLNNLAGTDQSYTDNTYYRFSFGARPENDMEAVEMLLGDALEVVNAPYAISGQFFTEGSKPVRSFDLYYSVNGSARPAKHFDNYQGSFLLTHDIPWTPSAPGVYTVKIWAENVNGAADATPANNSIEKQVLVVEKFPSRLALIESFTQHNCGPCAAQNPALEALVGQNETKTAVVKWVVTWPGPNNDPRHLFNSSDNLIRRTYYNVTGVPTTIFAGTWDGAPAGVTQNMVNQEIAKPGLFDLAMSEALTPGGDSIAVSISATPLQTLPKTFTLQAAIIQDELHYQFPTGSNGEIDFYHIMRYMVPNANGSAVPVTAGNTVTVSGKRKIDPIFAGSFVRIVTWVQDNATKEIFMAGKSKGLYVCQSGAVITPSLSITDAPCGQAQGAASLQLSGGRAPYSYQWSNGATASGITGLATGTYSVTVTDSTGCQLRIPFEVKPIGAPKVLLEADAATCKGAADGRAKAYVGGGTAPYTYLWSNGATSEEITGLAPGTYGLTVTDAEGCLQSGNAVITEPAVLAATAAQESKDDGSANGSASVSVNGGTFPYSYAWNTTPAQTSELATGLSAGEYQVTVTDYYGCQTTAMVTVASSVGIEDEMADAGLRKWKVYPVPASEFVTVEVEAQAGEQISLRLIHVNGQEISRQQLSGATQYEVRLDVISLPAGIYLLEAETSQGILRQRISLK